MKIKIVNGLNLPNFISLGRLLSVPVIVWLTLIDRYAIAFWLFAGAGLSDILDGLLARLLKEKTAIGAYLDPLADKTLLVALFVTLTLRNNLPLWLAIIVVFRDCIIIAGSTLLLLMKNNFEIKPFLISKINTFAQILLVFFILSSLAYHFPYHKIIIHYMIYFVAVTTIISGIAYLKLWIKVVDRNDQK